MSAEPNLLGDELCECLGLFLRWHGEVTRREIELRGKVIDGEPPQLTEPASGLLILIRTIIN
ncbi:hypothetical protein CHELA40_30017 [Chelatococcus asaccharovorans]|nr:hypothetical protein CHELA17_40043 [Chelatococcus asaccharovorans]CAH1687503.1 hypothetical protein CHELA40_30017 [Chelatococcus asaccharovorans]